MSEFSIEMIKYCKILSMLRNHYGNIVVKL